MIKEKELERLLYFLISLVVLSYKKMDTKDTKLKKANQYKSVKLRCF
jgi:hypothetical protein